ncbi:MAG: PPC domain-containing protein [Verrucomicrobiota bacterium]
MKIAALLTGALLFGSCMLVFAAPPTFDAIFPAGAKVGEEREVALVAKVTTWPPQIWCSSDKVVFEPLEKANQLKVKVAADAKPGPCLVRIYDGEGASPVRIFVVGDQPEIAEEVDNDTLDTAQPIESLPVLVNARLEKSDDIDFYRVNLKKDQQLRARIDGYSLRSMIDPFLHLYGPDGHRILLASESHNRDARFQFKAPADGAYTVRVDALGHIPNANVTFAGSGAMVYRLELTSSDSKIPIPRPKPTATEGSAGQAVTAPMRLAGVLSKPKEVDTFKWTAKKGDRINFKVEAQQLQYSPDAVLRITRPDDVLLRLVDDVKPYTDPVYLAAAPLDGDYKIEVWDRFRRGGPEFQYHLVLEEPTPDFNATADKDAYVLKAGEELSLTLKFARLNGHNLPINVEIEGLPEGVTLEPVQAPEKTGNIVVKLKANEDVAAANVPLTVKLVETEPESEPAAAEAEKPEESEPKPPFEPQTRVVPFSYILDTTARGDYLINENAALWLTVIPKPEPEEENQEEEKKEE